MTENSFPMCLSAKDAMRLTGWSRAMTYSMLHNTEAGAFQIGKRKFFHRDRLLEWLKEQSRSQASEVLSEVASEKERKP